MEEKYVTLIQNQMNEGGDPQLVRNLEFTVPTAETLARMYIKNLPYVDKNRDEVRATPVENIVAAKELLEHNKSPAALETAVKLMTKALVQQEKAMSSRRLESDPALCRSSTASKARGTGNYGTRLITNLIPDPQKSEEEKLATGHMPSQYPPTTSHMARARREIHHHLARITLPMDTSKIMLLPAIRPTCRHQSIRRSKSQREESSYATMMASKDEAVTLDAEMIRHDGRPVETADPSKGNDLAMTTACTAAATRISIALPAAAMTKGKAPAAMTTIHLHGEQREAVVAAEINRRTARVKDVTLRHLHRAARMAAAAAQQNHATLARIRRTRSPTTRVPT
jgi:hypothetical protein